MSQYMLTNMRSERKWFRSHNCGKEIPLVQSVLCACLSMPPIQSVTVAPSAGDYPSELEFNYTTPSISVAENAWWYILLYYLYLLCLEFSFIIYVFHFYIALFIVSLYVLSLSYFLQVYLPLPYG